MKKLYLSLLLVGCFELTTAQCPFIVVTLEPTYAMNGSVFLNGAGVKDIQPVKVFVQYEKNGHLYLSHPKSVTDTCLEWSASYRLKNLSPHDTIVYRYILSYGSTQFATGGTLCVAVPESAFDSTHDEVNLTYFFHPLGEFPTRQWDAQVEMVLSQETPKPPFDRVYPNPIEQNSWLHMGPGLKTVSVFISDLLGRGVFYGEGALDKVFIDLPRGLYIIAVKKEDSTYCLDKLIVW